MDYSNKIILTTTIPGSVMIPEEICEKNDYDYSKMVVSDKQYNKKAHKMTLSKETIYIATRKSIPASQVLNINKEAYLYFISNEMPSWWNKIAGNWKRMTKEQRLKAHLDRICANCNGLNYTFEILPD